MESQEKFRGCSILDAQSNARPQTGCTLMCLASCWKIISSEEVEAAHFPFFHHYCLTVVKVHTVVSFNWFAFIGLNGEISKSRPEPITGQQSEQEAVSQQQSTARLQNWVCVEFKGWIDSEVTQKTAAALWENKPRACRTHQWRHRKLSIMDPLTKCVLFSIMKHLHSRFYAVWSL